MVIDLIYTTETKMTFKISFRTTEKRNERKKVEREKANHILYEARQMGTYKDRQRSST